MRWRRANDRQIWTLLYSGHLSCSKTVITMKRTQLIVLISAVLPALSFAQSPQNHACTFGDLERRVEIVTEAGLDVPCEVHYYKDTEMPGERQVLWNAQTDAGYCASKAQEFVARLEGWGWDCGGGVMPSPDVVVAPSEVDPVKDVEEVQDIELEADDDTGALVPAEKEDSGDR